MFYWPPFHTVRVAKDAEFVLFSPQQEHTPVIVFFNPAHALRPPRRSSIPWAVSFSGLDPGRDAIL
jgi:hypothetical protein